MSVRTQCVPKLGVGLMSACDGIVEVEANAAPRRVRHFGCEIDLVNRSVPSSAHLSGVHPAGQQIVRIAEVGLRCLDVQLRKVDATHRIAVGRAGTGPFKCGIQIWREVGGRPEAVVHRIAERPN